MELIVQHNVSFQVRIAGGQFRVSAHRYQIQLLLNNRINKRINKSILTKIMHSRTFEMCDKMSLSYACNYLKIITPHTNQVPKTIKS